MDYHYLLFACFLCSCVPSVSFAQPYKAVSLGNWLVIEGWMKPSLFDHIPNKDLLVIVAPSWSYLCWQFSFFSLVSWNLMIFYCIVLAGWNPSAIHVHKAAKISLLRKWRWKHSCSQPILSLWLGNFQSKTATVYF